MTDTPWNSSAGAYATQSERISFYLGTNRALIAAAGLEPGMTIIDLACGAGLTTRTMLAALGDRCRVYAVDGAEEMVRQAKRGGASPAVQFIHASAEAFAQHVDAPVDRVLCNAAFWHFPAPHAVLQEVRAVLSPTGRFLFNLPDQEFDFGDGTPSEMARVVASCLAQPFSESTPSFSRATIKELASANGFQIGDYQIISIPLYPEDLIRFYAIPHVGARRLPDCTPEERQRRFAQAFSRLSAREPVIYRWAQFTFVPQAHVRVDQ